MSNKIYRKYFTVDQFENLKASTIIDLEVQEEKAVGMLIMMFASLFCELVMIVATILWMNKFTLFLSIVGLMFVSLLAILSRFSFKSFKESVKKAKEES